MTIHVIDLGPGLLKLVAPGPASIQLEAQLTNCRLTAAEQVTAGVVVPVLSAEELTGADRARYSYLLAGSLFQDFGLVDLSTAEAVVEWSWEHKGELCEFEFVPNTTGTKKAVGIVYPVPLQIGGPITGTPDNRGPNPTSDFSWRAKGPLGVDEKPTADPQLVEHP